MKKTALLVMLPFSLVCSSCDWSTKVINKITGHEDVGTHMNAACHEQSECSSSDE